AEGRLLEHLDARVERIQVDVQDRLARPGHGASSTTTTGSREETPDASRNPIRPITATIAPQTTIVLRTRTAPPRMRIRIEPGSPTASCVATNRLVTRPL